MAPYLRSVPVLVLALAANRADGETRAHAASSTARAAIANAASAANELTLDRSLATLFPTGPFVPYQLEAALESEACSALDQSRKIQGRIESAVIRTASEQLNLPMGSGRFLAVNGHEYLFCLEPHYREPGTGHGPTGWHKGVTVYDVSALSAGATSI